jgi:hypothetical protein
MWDMTDDPFEGELSGLFLKPTGEADPALLRLQVLERMEREDRRRRIVITAAAGLGAAIAAAAASSGLGAAMAAAAAASKALENRVLASSEMIDRALATVSAQPAIATAPWLLGVFCLAVGGVLAARAAREA